MTIILSLQCTCQCFIWCQVSPHTMLQWSKCRPIKHVEICNQKATTSASDLTSLLSWLSHPPFASKMPILLGTLNDLMNAVWVNYFLNSLECESLQRISLPDTQGVFSVVSGHWLSLSSLSWPFSQLENGAFHSLSVVMFLSPWSWQLALFI